MTDVRRSIVALTFFVVSIACISTSAQTEPGRRVSLGRYSLNINCVGHGGPTVVIETGLGDFAFDWFLVQEKAKAEHRVCTYDRAGYASSDVGPFPRTFAQINLELHELLQRAGEHPPYLLVGHSFGGAVVRNYALLYPNEVAGLVLAESVAERQPIIIGNKPTLLKEFAEGKPIPSALLSADIPTVGDRTSDEKPQFYSELPKELQELHKRFAVTERLETTEQSQRAWSSEYFGNWFEHSQKGSLGALPVVVLTRSELGNAPNANYSVEAVDGQRLRAQAELLGLSSNSVQLVVRSGHNMQVEAPEAIVWAVTLVSNAVKSKKPIGAGAR
jgi:pimeloyl-ACP methyl ester carboxylesterase